MRQVESRNSKILFALLSVLLVGYLFGANLQADFWLIDDHSILTFMQNAKNGFSDFFKLVSMSEVGQFGKSNRYRPGYYTVYVLEALTWGAKPFFWYLFRLLMCSVFVYACLRTVSRYFGFFAAILFTALAFSFSYWTDIWSRLGPGESYCALGLGLFLLSYTSLLQPTTESAKKWYWVLGLGVFLAAGAKENFLILALPLLWLGFKKWKTKSLTPGLIVTLSLSLVYIGVIFVELAMALSQIKADFYANPVTFETRLEKAKAVFSNREFLLSFIFMILGFVGAKISKSKARFNDMFRPFQILGIVSTCCLFLVLTQVVFYNGQWPTYMRYDFPGMLVAPLIVVTIYFVMQSFIAQRTQKKALLFLLPVLFFVFTFGKIRSGFANLRNGAKENVDRSLATKRNVDLIVQTMKEHPQATLILESHNPINYESIISLKVFLNFNGVQNSILVRTHTYSSATEKTDLYRFLASAIEGWQAKDQAQLDQVKECFSVHFAGKETTNCTDLAQF